MKKRAFIILFIIISLSLFYLPYSQSVSPAGFCYPSNTKNLILSSQSEKTIPANFTYDGVKTIFWEFLVRENDAKIRTSSLTSQCQIDKGSLDGWGGGNSNCKYYSFSHLRWSNRIEIRLPSKSSRPETIDGKKICYYGDSSTSQCLVNVLSEGLTATNLGINVNNIIYRLLAGEGASLKQTCDNFNEAPSQSGVCPPSQKCKIKINSGSTSYYGYTFEKDSCGNRLVLPDNDGKPMSYAERNQRAENFIKECSKKYEINPSTNSLCKNAKNAKGEVCGNCGNGKIEEGEECDEGKNNGKGYCSLKCIAELPKYCKKAKPPGVIFCKECLDYKNKFGRNKKQTLTSEDSCSYISLLGRYYQKKDGEDCRLWLEGGHDVDDWNDYDSNSAWGICKNGVCVHSINALPPSKACSCECDDPKTGKIEYVGWNEYCKFTKEMCVKKTGKISKLKDNICVGNSRLICTGNEGDETNPIKAKENCEKQGKLFYTEVFIGDTADGVLNVEIGVTKLECHCDNLKSEICK